MPSAIGCLFSIVQIMKNKTDCINLFVGTRTSRLIVEIVKLEGVNGVKGRSFGKLAKNLFCGSSAMAKKV